MGAVYLAVTQPAMQLHDYRNAEAFAGRVLSLTRAALIGRPPDMDAVVLFPEEIGAFLPIAGVPRAGEARTLEEAFGRVVRAAPGRLLRQALRHRPRSLKELALAALAPDAFRWYRAAFAEAARTAGAYVVAGSALLADLPDEGDGRPALRRSAGRVYNTTVVFGPDGRIVAHAAKSNLVPTQEDDLGLTGAPPSPGALFEVEGVRFAVLICYDAFTRPHTSKEPAFTPLVPLADEAGADVLLQPSANPWPWEERWVFAAPGDTRLRREQWAEESVEAALAACSHARYAATSHLTAHLLGARFEGTSAIFARMPEGVRTLARTDTYRPEDGDRFATAVVET